MRRLKADYGIEKIDRRSVRANVQSLVDMGYGIENEGDDGYYMYEREFEDAELRILIDSVLFSKTVSDSAAKKLIEKLKGFGNIYFDAKVSHVKPTPLLHRTDNKSVLYNVSAINEAMDQKKKITFRYNRYGTDFKMHDQGKDYIMNPYQMVATNGRYYLIANMERHDNVSHYRLDHIRDIEITDTPAKPQRKVEGLENGLDLPKHMAEHVYMFTGESQRVIMRTTPGMAGELIDWFGSGVTFSDETETSVIAHITANLQAMRFWALQYAPYVTVLAPQSLVDTVKADLGNALKYYGEENHE